jgi:hypothetical protein
MYGSEVSPKPPQQDMFEIDTIAGTIGDRSSDQAQFTGGAGPTGEHGLGGQAEPPTTQGDGARSGAPGTIEPGTVYERIGF